MKINEDGRWGILKLSNTFWPRSLQGPEHGGSGYVHMLPGFLGREITESVVAILRHHQARRQSNARAERMEPSDAVGAMPGLRSDSCRDLQEGGRRREAGSGPRLPQGCGIYRRLSRLCWDGCSAAAASRTAVSASEPAPGAATLRRA